VLLLPSSATSQAKHVALNFLLRISRLDFVAFQVVYENQPVLNSFFRLE